MNLLDYANFKLDDYEPSNFRELLVKEATNAYKAYTEGRVVEMLNNVPVETSVSTVVEYFSEALSQMDRTHEVFEDINYTTIMDDLMLYVDENNIALKKHNNKTIH